MSDLNRSFCLWSFQFIIFLGLLVLLLWLSLRPKKPSYTVVELDVSTANATTITFGMEISNPNKRAGVYYDDMNVTVILIVSDVADDTSGCFTTINGFYQGHHKTATLGRSLQADERAWGAVMAAVRNGTAKFRVGVTTKVRYKVAGVKSRRRALVVEGGVGVGSDGKISGKTKRVKLRHGRTKWRSRIAG